MSSSSSISEHGGRRPKGALLYTGPDGIGDHRVAVKEDPSFVGHRIMSTEATSDTSYLYRAPKETVPYPRARSAKVGEVGWGVVKLMDYTLLKSGHQIMLKEFRQANEDRYTHRYQDPYYPPPTEQQQKHQLTQQDKFNSEKVGHGAATNDHRQLSRTVTIEEPFHTAAEGASKVSLSQQSQHSTTSHSQLTL